MSDITDLIAAYRRGEMTLADLARRFRERTWPEPARPHPAALEESYRRELEDPEPLQDGSFHEVIAAYDRGDISGDEYDVLAGAATEAIREQRTGG